CRCGSIKGDREVNSAQLHILQHSLGLDIYGRGSRYRNRFVTGPGGDDFKNCRELCDLGFMQDNGPMVIAGGMHLFSVTAAGLAAIAENSPPPKVGRSKRRYLQWLKAD